MLSQAIMSDSVFIKGRSVNTSCSRMMGNLRRSFSEAVSSEQQMNFAPYKDKKNKSWSVKMVCLASKEQSTAA